VAAKTFAYCLETGEIGFGKTIPDGAIGIAEGQENQVRARITSSARRGSDNVTLLVPGLRESEGMAKVSVVARYIEALKAHNRHGFRAIGV
jgi:hypothetical protein